MIREYLESKLPAAGQVDDLQEIGIGSFTAFVRVKEEWTKTNEVTDIFLEDGSTAHDHINVKPVTLTIDGQVADIFIRPFPPVQAYTRTMAELSSLAGFSPGRTATQLAKVSALVNTANDAISRVDDLIGRAGQAYDFFGNKSPGTDPKQMFVDELVKLMDTRQAIQISMPHQNFQNMVITTGKITRDNTTNRAISFSITAKQIRYAKTLFSEVQALKKNPAPGETKEKTAEVKSKGVNKPVSFLSRIGELW